MADDPDRVDIKATLSGDGDAYARLVERHSPAVQRQVRGYSRDPLVVEELSQEVFVEAFLSLANYRGDAPFSHWLARIATHLGYKYWKTRDRNKMTVSLSEVPDLAAAKTEEATPSQASELLFELFAVLPDDDRLVLTLMYLEDCGQEEIAKRLGWTRVGVAVRIHRAKHKLRKLAESSPWKERLSWLT